MRKHYYGENLLSLKYKNRFILNFDLTTADSNYQYSSRFIFMVFFHLILQIDLRIGTQFINLTKTKPRFKLLSCIMKQYHQEEVYMRHRYVYLLNLYVNCKTLVLG